MLTDSTDLGLNHGPGWGGYRWRSFGFFATVEFPAIKERIFMTPVVAVLSQQTVDGVRHIQLSLEWALGWRLFRSGLSFLLGKQDLELRAAMAQYEAGRRAGLGARAADVERKLQASPDDGCITGDANGTP